MLNYKGVIQERLPERIKDSNLKIIDDTYRVLIPTLSKSTYVEAKVISTSYSRVRYDKDDIVVVGQIDTTGDYIILGLVQKMREKKIETIDDVSIRMKEIYAMLTTNTFKTVSSSILIGRQEISKKILKTLWSPSSGIYYYQINMIGYSVIPTSQVGIIPLLASSDTVAEAGIYPYVKVETDKVTVYAKRVPLEDIDVIVEVIN